MSYMDINQVMETVPHRYPFLMIDRVLEVNKERIIGLKNVTINEPYFQGHFPKHPVMPGTLIIEGMAQLSCAILLNTPETKGKIAYFASMNNVRFRKPVFPGDQIRYEVDVKKIKGAIAKTIGKAFVDGNLAAEADMTFSLVNSQLEVMIDSSAKIHPNAFLGRDVKVGPHAYIGEGVVIGNNVTIEANVVIERWTTIHDNTHIKYGTIIGNATQDLKYKGEKSFVVIGKNCDIREYVTINRPTTPNGTTRIGDNCFLLTMVHVAHDCVIGNNVVITNATQIAGHVKIEDNVVMGGMAGITQYSRIGTLTMIGAYSKVNQDVPPYMLVEGNPACIRTMNVVGIDRNGISKANQKTLKEAYRILFRSEMNTTQAIEKIKKEMIPLTPEVERLLKFIQSESKNGIMKRSNK
jgi:UDP-N-acetylglucosamine acyltransferase